MSPHERDIRQVRQLSKQLNIRAGEMQNIVSQVTTILRAVPWTGPDAERFRSAWSDTHLPHLDSAIAAIQDAAQDAGRNADEHKHNGKKH